MEIIRRSFYSQLLNKEYVYEILLSGEENVDDTVNLLYVHDGKDYLQLGGIENAIDQLLLEFPKEIGRFIAILLHPGDSQERWHSYNREGRCFQSYIKFMNEECIPKIEEDFANVKILKRGLIGDSLAANISLNIALQHPEIWTHLLLQSAAISIGDIEEAKKAEKLDWQIYQSVGIHEDEFVSPITNSKLYILSRNRELYQTFKVKKANIFYREFDEYHLWTFWKKDLPDALRFFLLN